MLGTVHTAGGGQGRERNPIKALSQCMTSKKSALVLARAIQTLSPMRSCAKKCRLVLARAIPTIVPLATFGCRPVHTLFVGKAFSGCDCSAALVGLNKMVGI